MRKLFGFAVFALLLYMLGGCSGEPKVNETRAEAKTGEVAAPVLPKAGQFDAYDTGVRGVYRLVDRDNGCEYIATYITSNGYGSVGMSGITPRVGTCSK